MLTRRQTILLHVAKSKLGLDDDCYRDILERFDAVRSSKDLSFAGYLKVMAHFKLCGFEPMTRRTDEPRESPRPGMASPGQLKKLRVLWLLLAGTYYRKGDEWKTLRGFLKKRFQVSHENFLDFETCHKAIEGIKMIVDRKWKESRG